MERCNFFDLKGHTIERFDLSDTENQYIYTNKGKFALQFIQECCESVCCESIIGTSEKLIGYEVILAEEDIKEHSSGSGNSETITTYTIQTQYNLLYLIWIGSSNGYYGETAKVSFEAK
jgi:hypothetical protein